MRYWISTGMIIIRWDVPAVEQEEPRTENGKHTTSS